MEDISEDFKTVGYLSNVAITADFDLVGRPLSDSSGPSEKAPEKRMPLFRSMIDRPGGNTGKGTVEWGRHPIDPGPLSG
ncbi:MAG: hypothetical protein P8010_00480 [Desulfosarcinaceae bacterium]